MSEARLRELKSKDTTTENQTIKTQFWDHNGNRCCTFSSTVFYKLCKIKPTLYHPPDGDIVRMAKQRQRRVGEWRVAVVPSGTLQQL